MTYLYLLHFRTRRAFIEKLNFQAEFNALDETTLSRQLSGKIEIGHGWRVAYTLFFERCERRHREKELA